MSGQNRVEANRHNAQPSTGPQTASGKTGATLKLAEQSQFSARTERRMTAPAAQQARRGALPDSLQPRLGLHAAPEVPAGHRAVRAPGARQRFDFRRSGESRAALLTSTFSESTINAVPKSPAPGFPEAEPMADERVHSPLDRLRKPVAGEERGIRRAERSA
jgi:hypothetical protein